MSRQRAHWLCADCQRSVSGRIQRRSPQLRENLFSQSIKIPATVTHSQAEPNVGPACRRDRQSAHNTQLRMPEPSTLSDADLRQNGGSARVTDAIVDYSP